MSIELDTVGLQRMGKESLVVEVVFGMAAASLEISVVSSIRGAIFKRGYLQEGLSSRGLLVSSV